MREPTPYNATSRTVTGPASEVAYVPDQSETKQDATWSWFIGLLEYKRVS